VEREQWTFFYNYSNYRKKVLDWITAFTLGTFHVLLSSVWLDDDLGAIVEAILFCPAVALCGSAYVRVGFPQMGRRDYIILLFQNFIDIPTVKVGGAMTACIGFRLAFFFRDFHTLMAVNTKNVVTYKNLIRGTSLLVCIIPKIKRSIRPFRMCGKILLKEFQSGSKRIT
jgi:hypothetical protein